MNTVLFAPKFIHHKINILLIGCGGTGSEMLDNLYRIHCCITELGHEGLRVMVVDGDNVEPHNIGRQRFWPGDVGCNKAVCAVNRYNAHGGTAWEGVPMHISPDPASWEWQPDIIITAVDSGEFRYELGKATVEFDDDGATLWLDGGVSGNDGQVILGGLGKLVIDTKNHEFNRLPNVFDLYGQGLITDKPVVEGCSSLSASLAAQGLYINRLCADVMGEMLYQLIRDGQLSYHGSFFSTAPYQVSPMAIDTNQWNCFPALIQAAA